MFPSKRNLLAVLAIAFVLTACSFGDQNRPRPGASSVTGTDVDLPAATNPPEVATQSPEPATSEPDQGVATTPPIAGGLKPADSDSPAAGICMEPQDDPVSVILGVGLDGLPLAGRCIKITPAQRISLINQSGGPLNFQFGEYQIDLQVGGEMLLEKPAGQFLDLGVHFLPMGPELWVAGD